MEFIATLVGLGFASWSLISAFRLIEAATAQSVDSGVRRAKRGFYLAFAGLNRTGCGDVRCSLRRVAVRPYLCGETRDGHVPGRARPLCLWLVLAQIRAMGLEGEGPAIFSQESRRRMRLPIIAGTVMGVLTAVVLVWFGPRTAPAEDETDWTIAISLCLTFAGAGWPMFVVHRCVERDRAAARKQSFAGVQRPPSGDG
jgi:hypothetical protein